VWAGDTGYDEVLRVIGEPAMQQQEQGAEGAGAGAGAAPTADLPAAPARPLVLIADDDPTQRVVTAAALTAEGFDTAEAENGVEALNQSQRLHPALLLLDMEMPRMGGFEVLATLRERLSGRGIPVIIVTSLDDAETESRCIELGAEDYIVKPIRPATLVARVRAVLRRVAVS
jgi:two-component system response regulator AdeR